MGDSCCSRSHQLSRLLEVFKVFADLMCLVRKNKNKLGSNLKILAGETYIFRDFAD